MIKEQESFEDYDEKFAEQYPAPSYTRKFQ